MKTKRYLILATGLQLTASNLLVCSVSALTLNSNPIPQGGVTLAHYESSSHNFPLGGLNKNWIGEVSYQWLNNTTNQNTLDGIWSTYNSFGPGDGWQLNTPEGNVITITSYWQRPYGNSFSFSVPNDETLKYSIYIPGGWQTQITQWSEIGYISYVDYWSQRTIITTQETGAGIQLNSIDTDGLESRYDLVSGGIYSVSQNGPGSGPRNFQDSFYLIFIEPSPESAPAIPEPSAYGTALGIAGLSFAMMRRRKRAITR